MLLRLWDTIERWLIGILGAAALLICLWQIVGRYISNDLALAWGEELAVYVIIWAALLTASSLVREDGHVRADLVIRLLTPQRQRLIEIFNCAVAVIFCAGMCWYGYLVSFDAYDIGEKSMTSLAFPMWLYYAALPVTTGLMLIRYLIRLHGFIFRYDPETMALQSGHES